MTLTDVAPVARRGHLVRLVSWSARRDVVLPVALAVLGAFLAYPLSQFLHLLR